MIGSGGRLGIGQRIRAGAYLESAYRCFKRCYLADPVVSARYRKGRAVAAGGGGDHVFRSRHRVTLPESPAASLGPGFAYGISIVVSRAEQEIRCLRCRDRTALRLSIYTAGKVV